MTNSDRTRTVSPVLQGRSTDATAASLACDTVSSNNISNKVSSKNHMPFQSFSIDEVEIETPVSRKTRMHRHGRFLKGPILMRELAIAAWLPGQALALLLVIHHQTALTRKATVTLPRGLLAQFGIGKDAKARSLRQLEDVRLIRVVRSTGRSALVGLEISQGAD
jgi:hypothetical protein